MARARQSCRICASGGRRRRSRGAGRALSLWSGAAAGEWPASGSLEAIRRPFVTYDGAQGPTERAWAAKIEADRDPPVVVRSRIPQFAAAIASAIFLVAFFGGRDAAVTALPDLAGLYAAIGLPVNLDGFAIAAVEAERRGTGVAATLVVRGRIENVSGVARPVPPLVVGFQRRRRHAELRSALARHRARRGGAVRGDHACRAGQGGRDRRPAQEDWRRRRPHLTGNAAPPASIRTLFTAEEIAARVAGLAEEIAASRPTDLLVVIVLKGGFVFARRSGARPRPQRRPPGDRVHLAVELRRQHPHVRRGARGPRHRGPGRRPRRPYRRRRPRFRADAQIRPRSHGRPRGAAALPSPP